MKTQLFCLLLLSACTKGTVGKFAIDAGLRDAASGLDAVTADGAVVDTCKAINQECVQQGGWCDVNSGTCVAAINTVLMDRYVGSLCSVWRARTPRDDVPAWTPTNNPAGACDNGAITAQAISDTLKMLNTYRWLVGLGNSAQLNNQETGCDQACAAQVAGNGARDPKAMGPCSTSESRTCGAVNRSRYDGAVSTPALVIPVFMRDAVQIEDASSIAGNRSALLGKKMNRLRVGFKLSEPNTLPHGAGTCLGYDQSVDIPVTRAWIAYPNPGPAPSETVQGVWSFHSLSADVPLVGATVSVEDISESPNARTMIPSPSTRDVLYVPIATGAAGEPTLTWTLNNWTVELNHTYQVTVTMTNGATIQYSVKPVDCYARENQ